VESATLVARWAPTIITLLSLAAGLGLMWGVLKTSLQHLGQQVDRLQEQCDRNEEMMVDMRVRFAENDVNTARKRRGRK
jgi:hypothetical protein